LTTCLVVIWAPPRTSEAVAEWMQAPRVHMLKFTLVAAHL
jgi:hypothetical protein